MLDEGLLLRRINIRSLLPFPGTEAAAAGYRVDKRTENRYRYFRDLIRADIDHRLLQQLYPAGTVLRQVRIEAHDGEWSLGRRLASYPITVKMPGVLPAGAFCDVLVTGHRERSLSGLPLPVVLTALSRKGLEMLPGIGKKTASMIAAGQHADSSGLQQIVHSLPEAIRAHIRLY